MNAATEANSRSAHELTMETLEFFAGAGEMAQLMRSFDWSQTSLGDPETWPQSLKTCVRLVLTSRFSMWFGWGPDLVFFYNDAYRHDTLGMKHPWALGKKASTVWEEVWSDLSPRVDTVLKTGVATWDEALLLFLQRSGFSEETYHTFSYSPLADDQGQVSGVFCVVTEETARVIGERRLELLRNLGERFAASTTEPEVLEALKLSLGSHSKDVPFSMVYLFDSSGKTATLVSSSGVEDDAEIAQKEISSEEFGGFWPVSVVLATSKPVVVQGLQEKFNDLPKGPWDQPPREAVVVAIPQQGSDRPAGFLIVGANPYRPLDDAYLGFIELLVGQTSSAIASARAYEAERQRAEELAKLDLAKTTFFSNVSHELRTPLTLMLGPLENLLSPDEKLSEQARQRVELAHRNSVRLLKLVNTLLDFSRLEAGRVQAYFEPVDLSALTVEMASSFRSACEHAGLNLIVNCPLLPEPVYVDRNMWEKIVLNLLSNALKYTFRGEIEVDLAEKEDRVVLSVRDTGTGIPAESVPHLFERFYRVEGARGRTHEGTGIGLSLVLELAKLHGGDVEVLSEVGKGSTFEVSLPYGKAHLPADKIGASPESVNLTLGTGVGIALSDAFVGEAEQWLKLGEFASGPEIGQKTDALEGIDGSIRAEILVADDNADLREYLHRLLSEFYAVTVVSNGDEALNAAREQAPDLILTDVMMPVMDGFELLAAVRGDERLREIPVVMLSARAGEEAKVEGLQVGADDYLVKPFSARELLARVKSNIELSRLRKVSALREEKLRRSAEASYLRMKEFAESLPQMAAERDALGEVRWANERFAEYTGFDIDTLSPEQARSVMSAQDWESFYRLWARALESGEIQHSEAKMRRKDGQWRWWLLTMTPVRDAENQVERVYLSATDIHEHKELEEELERRVQERTTQLVEANREMEGFTYTVSHDLRSPLRSIIFNSAVLLDEAGASLEQEHRLLLERQMHAAKRLAQLIDDLLKLSRVSRQEINLRPVDVTGIARQVLDQLHLPDEKKSTVQIEPGMAAVADGQLLQFVYLNLIENACKFSPTGGRIDVGVQEDGGEQVFFVQDRGIGFDLAYAEKVFQAFERLVRDDEFPGTGIGLANVKRIVERHRGRIWVESEPGKGSTFFFTLSATPLLQNG